MTTSIINDGLRRQPGGRRAAYVLDLQRATRFVPTRAENYQGIESAARSAGLL